MQPFLTVLGLLLSLILPPSAAASPDETGNSEFLTLVPGQLLRIGFSTSPPFAEMREPDTLYVFFGFPEVVMPFGLMTGVLYDGSSVLGVSTSAAGAGLLGTISLNPAGPTWKSAVSPWDFPAGDPVIVDFTSILNGSIAGTLEFSIDTGEIRIDTGSLALRLIDAQSAQGGELLGSGQILSVSLVPVPEPTMAWLLVCGLGVLMVVGVRRKRSAEVNAVSGGWPASA